MKTGNILVYLPMLVAVACQVQFKSSRNSASQYKAIYVEQFKLSYFRAILHKGYNNSTAIQEIITADHSGFTEPILTADDYKLIDSLARADNEQMKLDSAEGNRRAEGSQGKRPIGYIHYKLQSKSFDSLARVRLKLSGVAKAWAA